MRWLDGITKSMDMSTIYELSDSNQLIQLHLFNRRGFPGGSMVKNLSANAGESRETEGRSNLWAQEGPCTFRLSDLELQAPSPSVFVLSKIQCLWSKSSDRRCGSFYSS